MDQLDPNLALIKNAKTIGLSWVKVATALAELGRSGPTDPTGTPWLYRAAEMSGYGVGQLRRILRSWTFLNSLTDVLTDREIRSLHAEPVSSIEVLLRLHSLAPDLAIERLKSYLYSRGPTYRQLLKIYDEVADTAASKLDNQRAGQRLSRDFTDICFDLIRQNIFQLTGDRHAEIIRPTRNAYDFTHPDFVLVQRSADPGRAIIVDAVEVQAATSHPKSRSMSRLHADVALGASFFRWFWVVLPNGADVSKADADFSLLCLDNVGIVAVDTTDRPICRVQRVPHGLPKPDRRKMIKG